MKWGLSVSEKEFLPKTRAWVADYEQWIAEGCPTPEEEAARKAEAAKATPTGPTFAEWVEKNPAPDLQKLVERAGRRYAASMVKSTTRSSIQAIHTSLHKSGWSTIGQ